MAYERDADAMHHGVGAIAAVDSVTSARRLRTARRNEAMRAKDKRRARMTFGPRGGLGLVSLTSSPGIPSAPPILTGPPAPSDSQYAILGVLQPTGVMGRPTSTVQNCKPGYIVTSRGCLPGPGVSSSPPITTTSGGTAPVSCATGYYLDPKTGACVPNPDTSPTSIVPSSSGAAPASSVSGGKSGGGVGAQTVPGTTMQVTPIDQNPDMPPPDGGEQTSASSLLMPQNLLIGAAALGALYLLFGKKGA